MIRFAALLDSLIFTPSRNGKVRLLKDYFAEVPDPERGWAVGAFGTILATQAAALADNDKNEDDETVVVVDGDKLAVETR